MRFFLHSRHRRGIVNTVVGRRAEWIYSEAWRCYKTPRRLQRLLFMIYLTALFCLLYVICLAVNIPYSAEFGCCGTNTPKVVIENGVASLHTISYRSTCMNVKRCAIIEHFSLLSIWCVFM
uniref:Seipin n=1 Tax=Parascaris univalens TaxID=6257 RepID=A0A915CI11_PARUN